MAKAGPDVVVAVASDHGHIAVNRSIAFNVALRNAGLLTLAADGSVDLFRTKAIYFPGNTHAYLSYRLIFPTVVGPGGNSMQISEVELLGVVTDLATDVTRPGDPIVATSNNSPGSEGVANAIDNQPTKYLNFDRLNTGFTVRPTLGLTTVSGLTLTSANDAPERDPRDWRFYGVDRGSFLLKSQLLRKSLSEE